MTWCRNGRYFYRSRREGDRVVSEYLGAGAVGEAVARREDARRAQALAARGRERSSQEEARALEATLHDLARASDELLAEALTAAGYHRHHRGEWRLRRQGS
jgi:hypothetical protein